jgi:hypothetical protein
MQEEIGMTTILILRIWKFSGGSDLKSDNFDTVLIKFIYLFNKSDIYPNSFVN